MNWTELRDSILHAARLRTYTPPRRFGAAIAAFVLTWLAASTSASAITLSWASTTGADGIQIERATSSGGPWSQIATTAGTATNYVDSGATCSVAYYYRIRAYNSAGESGYSNVAGPATAACCGYSISPATAAMPAGGGSGSVSVTATSGCSWTATSNVGWITITGGSSGTGNGTVNYSVAANTSSSALTGTVTIAGQTFGVTESGVACTYTLSATSKSYTSSGGSGSVGVTAPGGCAWTAASNVGWITITGGGSGAGNGTVSYSVAANTSSSALTGTVTIAGQTFTVTESGVACTYTLSATSKSYTSSGGSGSVGVTTPGGCGWTATSNVGWITITSGSSGTGNGTVSYTVAANASSGTLTGTVTIAGQTFTVTESGVSCSYTLSATTASYTSSGGSGSIGVTAPGGCGWTATSNAGWITITSGSSGTGSGTVSYTVAANASSGTLTGTVTIAGQTLTVTESGVSCSYTLSASSQAAASGGGSYSVNVTAPGGCAWTVSNTNSWITITAGTGGTGNGTVGYSVVANNTGARRTGMIVIGGQDYMVSQASSPCTYTLSATTIIYPSTGGSGSVNIAAGGGCAWTAGTTNSWITITGGSSGTGTGTVSYSVSADGSSVGRAGSIVIGGQTLTVIEAGASCTYSLSAGGMAAGSGGGSYSVDVVAPDGCGWSANNTNSWITITSGSGGSGDGTVGFSVAANSSGATRSGVITIGGQSYTVTQTSSACTYGLSSGSASYDATGGTGTVNVTAGSSCAWTAVSNVGWITITSGSSGTGNATVSYSVGANTSSSTLTGTVTVAGQEFTIIVSGVQCSYTLSATNAAYDANGGSGTVDVTAPDGCSWTADSNDGWITITAGSGSGNGTVSYSVATNTSSSTLTGAVVIAGQTLTVIEDGAPCSYTLSATNISYSASGGSDSVTVTAPDSCAWTAVSNDGWISITDGGNGTGNGTVNFLASANISSDTLTGTITVAGQTFTVIEAGVECVQTLSAISASYSADGGSGPINVTAPVGCGWTLTSNDGWISITDAGSGAGNGTVNYSVAANAAPTARTGTVTVAGQTFTIIEDGSPCTYTLSAASASYPSAGGSGTVNVTAPSGCAWTAASSDSWITITGGNSGVGNGTVSYTVSANTSPDLLTGTLTIGGQTFTVTAGPLVASQVTITNNVDTVGGMPVVLAGEPVSFNAGTIGDGTTPLTYAWDFDDGSTSTDSAPEHAFADCGPHTVTVAISDGVDTTNVALKVAVPCAMSVTNFQATLNFARANLDKCTFKAVPQPGQCTNWLGTVITIDVGDAQVSFTLDQYGRGVSTNGTCRFAYAKRSGTCTLTVNLSHGSWQGAWSAYGLVNATIQKPGSGITLPVALTIGNEMFMADKPLHYTAVTNKSGLAK